LQTVFAMQQNRIRILSTRPLSNELIEHALQAGIELEIVPFIETEAIQSIEVQQEIQNAILQTATAVFTSGNAVEAVAAELEGQYPNWEIFCLGKSTMDLASRYFGLPQIAGYADNAQDLAEVIGDSSNATEVIFFCGDQRRHELPDSLRQKGIEVAEIVVYQTVLVPQKLKKNYHGILFFSPSAVNSFFKLNTPGERTILFAIGNTTASELRTKTKNKVLVSEEPSKVNVVEMAIEFFT
jgi:uroporphyrinogen-III synthase